MAAATMYYRPEKTNYLVTPTESWKPSKQIPIEPDIHLWTASQDLPRADVARELPTEETLSLEIAKLCNATLAIDDAFYDIGVKLSDAIKEQNKRINIYDTCCALKTQWNEHHITYQHLLWRSREFAGEAQGTVDDFRELVLPSLRDPNITKSEKQDIILEQIQVLQNTSQPSESLCQEFLNFGRTLDKYIADFSRAVEGFGIAEKSKRVAGLEDRLHSARTAMDALSQEVKKLGWKFAADVAVTGITLLLAFVAPEWWEKLADAASFGIDCVHVKNSGFQLLDMRRQRDLVAKEYEAIKAEYNLESVCLSQTVKLESTLNNARPLVQEVTMKLGIFANVWAAITADIRKLKNSLHHAEDPTSKLFIRRVQRLEKMYGYLSQALRHYQVKVRLT